MRNSPQLSLFGVQSFYQQRQAEERQMKPDVIAALRCLGLDAKSAQELADNSAGATAEQWISNALARRRA